jgi:tRNA nucleotidyltransferase (CCA-adding enzyme)
LRTTPILDCAAVAGASAEESISLSCEAPSDEILLVDWLNSLIYEMAVRQMLFHNFSVAITDGALRAEVTGESVKREKHQPAVEVKGATYTALAVKQADDGWVVQCVVDV